MHISAQTVERRHHGADVGLGEVREVPLGEEHPEPGRRSATMTSLDEVGEAVGRDGVADPVCTGRAVGARDGVDAHRLPAGGEAQDEVPVAHPAEGIVEAAHLREHRPTVGDGVDVAEVRVGEGVDRPERVPHPGRTTDVVHDELPGQGPLRVRVLLERLPTRARWVGCQVLSLSR